MEVKGKGQEKAHREREGNREHVVLMSEQIILFWRK
jgi:hypothetical protein